MGSAQMTRTTEMTRTTPPGADAACLDAEVEGAVNFRDLGGLPAAGGRLRSGRLYRAGMTHHIGPAGLRLLAGRYRLRTVIDLRTADELAAGLAPWSEAGITYHHVPVLVGPGATNAAALQRAAALRSGAVDWAGLYAGMLDDGAPAFRRVFATLARSDALPAVVHCAGGRDRTGVVAALVLAALGVEDGAIAADYARTGALLRPHVDRFVPYLERMRLSREEMLDLLDTKEESMLRLLESLRARHGTPAAYLGAIGVDAAAVGALREALVEPVAPPVGAAAPR
jgi:protein-tyrosine phosphatase